MSEQPHEKEPSLAATLEKTQRAALAFAFFNALLREAGLSKVFSEGSVFSTEKASVEGFFEGMYEQLSELLHYSSRSIIIQEGIPGASFAPSEEKKFLRAVQESVKKSRDVLDRAINVFTLGLLLTQNPELKERVQEEETDQIDENCFDTLKRITEGNVMDVFHAPEHRELEGFYKDFIEDIATKREQTLEIDAFKDKESFLGALKDGCYSYINSLREMVKQHPDAHISKRPIEEAKLPVAAGVYILGALAEEKALLNELFIDLVKHNQSRGTGTHER